MDLSADTAKVDCERVCHLTGSFIRLNSIKPSQTRANYTKTIVDICELVWLTLTDFSDILISEREQEGK